MVPVEHILFLGAILFSIGLMVVVIKRNAIMVLVGIELMLNAANLNLAAFNLLNPDRLDGQLFILFVIVIAVCEAAVGLAIIMRVYNEYKTTIPDSVNELKE